MVKRFSNYDGANVVVAKNATTTQNQVVAKFAIVEKEGKRIADHTLVALTIMTAESRPEEKEMMVSVIMNCMQ